MLVRRHEQPEDRIVPLMTDCRSGPCFHFMTTLLVTSQLVGLLEISFQGSSIKIPSAILVRFELRVKRITYPVKNVNIWFYVLSPDDIRRSKANAGHVEGHTGAWPCTSFWWDKSQPRQKILSGFVCRVEQQILHEYLITKTWLH